MYIFIFGLCHGKTGLRAYADCQCPDQPEHLLTESLDTTEHMNGEQRPG